MQKEKHEIEIRWPHLIWADQVLYMDDGGANATIDPDLRVVHFQQDHLPVFDAAEKYLTELAKELGKEKLDYFDDIQGLFTNLNKCKEAWPVFEALNYLEDYNIYID